MDKQSKKLKEGEHKMLQRNIFSHPRENQFWGKFQVERLFPKLWPLLYKRDELDLRSTKLVIISK